MKVRYRFTEIEGSRGGSAEVGDDGGDALVEAEPGQELLAAALQVSQGEPECRCFGSLWGCEEFQVACAKEWEREVSGTGGRGREDSLEQRMRKWEPPTVSCIHLPVCIRTPP